MPDKTTEYLLKITADTAGVKQATKAMSSAEQQARTLAGELVKGSKFVGSSVSQAYTKAGQSITLTSSIFRKAGKEMTVTVGQVGKVSGVVTSSIKSMADASKTASPLVGNLTKALARVLIVAPIWHAFRTIYMSTLRLIQSSVKFLKDWEYQIAQIRIVTDASNSSIQQLSGSLINLSRTLGISTKELGEGAKLFAQQGRAIEEILPLMEATSRLSLLTGRTIVQSVEDMTAILKAYQLEARSATVIVDQITNVMLNHAITAGDLAQAYKQVSSTASSLGVSLESLTGYITAIKTVTRDTGSKVGLSLRTMFSRISTSSADAIQQLTGIPLFLDATGKATATATSNLRSLDQVISELASRFKDLGTAQKSQLAVLIGGVRRQNQVFALFDNFTEAIEAQADALFSLGEADDALATLTNTMELRVKRLNGAWQQFVDSIADTSGFKRGLAGLQELVETFSFMANRRAFETNVLREQLTELQKQAVEQEKFVTSVDKASKLIEQSVQSYKEGRKTLAEVRAETEIIGTRLNRVGSEFGVTIENIQDPTQFLQELQNQASRFKELNIQARINFEQASLRDQLLIVSNQIRSVFEEQLYNTPFDSATFKPIDDIINRLKTGNLDELTENLAFEGTSQSLDEINAKMAKLLEPKDAKTFQDLVNRFNDLGEAITNTDKLRIRFTEEYAREQKKLAEENLVSILSAEEVEKRLQELRVKAIQTNQSDLELTKAMLALLNDKKSVLSDQLEQKKDTLEIDLVRLERERELTRLKVNQNKVLAELKASGASNLQIAIQELAYLEQINATEEERLKKQEQISSLQSSLQANTYKTLIEATKDILSLQGLSEASQIRATIELEKQLGIEQNGLEALKQRLSLIQAIAKEEKKTKEERLQDLRNRIIQEKSVGGIGASFKTVASDFEESRLRTQAGLAGLTSEEVDKILNPRTAESDTELFGRIIRDDLPTELKRVLADPMNASMGELTSAIESLTQTVVSEESRAKGLTGLQRASTDASGLAPLPDKYQPSVVGFGAGGIIIDIKLGDKTISVPSASSPAQIRGEVIKILEDEDKNLENRLTDRIFKLLKEDNTKISNAVDYRINRY